jgi:hypothetical protein
MSFESLTLDSLHRIIDRFARCRASPLSSSLYRRRRISFKARTKTARTQLFSLFHETHSPTFESEDCSNRHSKVFWKEERSDALHVLSSLSVSAVRLSSLLMITVCLFCQTLSFSSSKPWAVGSMMKTLTGKSTTAPSVFGCNKSKILSIEFMKTADSERETEVLFP